MDFLHRREIALSIDGVKISTKEMRTDNTCHVCHHMTTRDEIPQNTGNNHKKWDVHIPEISFAINTAEHESTKHTPADIPFERNLKPPQQLIEQGKQPPSPAHHPPGPKECSLSLHSLNKSSEKQKRYYNLLRRAWQPQIKEKVLKRDHPILSSANNFAAGGNKKYKRITKTKIIISNKMERKPTRPIAPGKIMSRLRQTQMPRHVPAYLPPFEARPRIITVEQHPATTPPLHFTTSLPEKKANTPTASSTGELPPQATPTTQTEPAREEDVLEDAMEDVLSLSAPEMSEEEESDDPFRGIKIPAGNGRRFWTIYPKGRPKVQVKIIKGWARLRCQGQERWLKTEN